VEGLPGSEPRHVLTREDEIAFIKEGTITYFIGDEVIFAVPVLPKDIPHHFVIISEKMKITLITTSRSFWDFFLPVINPYNGNHIPAPQRPSEARRKEVETLMNSFGIYYV